MKREGGVDSIALYWCGMQVQATYCGAKPVGIRIIVLPSAAGSHKKAGVTRLFCGFVTKVFYSKETSSNMAKQPSLLANPSISLAV